MLCSLTTQIAVFASDTSKSNEQFQPVILL
ncbi:hypothetical protein FHS67_006165 [Aminobacter aminovorans]|uniref:Uncharacterized protein n=1 Tax=Aminobacter aminovorans TaxID=83263 RepID=A0ABR6HGZ0_AMIAI|nr:hypothetical protein [Aminobacter aminovorans]